MPLSAVIAAAGAEAGLSALADAGVRVAFAEPDAVGVAFAELGTPAGETWLVSSSPDAVDTARTLGLRSCYVGKDAATSAAAAAADIAIHEWAELTPALLDDFADSGGAQGAQTACRVLVVCGSPEPSSPELVARLADASDYVIACDAGAVCCREAGVAPHAFVGDGDSTDPETLNWARAVAARSITFPPEKYATDLALAIDAARHEAARRAARLELTFTCASGGRPDHALAVIGQLLKVKDAAPRMVEDAFELRILAPEGTPVWQLPQDAAGRTLSIVPLAQPTVVSERRLQWELDHRELPLLGDEGISNVVAGPDGEVECHAGALAVYLLS